MVRGGSESQVTKCDMAWGVSKKSDSTPIHFFIYTNIYFPICIHEFWLNLSLPCNSFIYEPVKIKDHSNFENFISLLELLTRNVFTPHLSSKWSSPSSFCCVQCLFPSKIRFMKDYFISVFHLLVSDMDGGVRVGGCLNGLQAPIATSYLPLMLHGQ